MKISKSINKSVVDAATPVKDLSFADILSMSIAASAKKKKVPSNRINTHDLQKKFEFDIRKGGHLPDPSENELVVGFELPQIEICSPQQLETYSPQQQMENDENWEPHGKNGSNFDEVEVQKIRKDEKVVGNKESLQSKLKSKIHDILMHQYYDILIFASLEQLKELKGIGKVRAQRIVELRKCDELTADNKKDSHEDKVRQYLDNAGMGNKAINKFIQDNVNVILGV